MAKQVARIPTGKGYFNGVLEELQKVTWPTRQDTIKLTAIVLIISLIIGAYIGIIDVLLTLALEAIAQ